jgi:ADP-glucose pyrophosphorylase
MSSIAEKLEYLIETKEKIKQSILDKNVLIDNNTSFREYAEKITEIKSESQPLVGLYNVKVFYPTVALGLVGEYEIIESAEE